MLCMPPSHPSAPCVMPADGSTDTDYIFDSLLDFALCHHGIIAVINAITNINHNMHFLMVSLSAYA